MSPELKSALQNLEHKVNAIGLMVAFLFWMEALRVFG